MKLEYSVDEANARLSEILRLVKQGKRITITEHGRPIARVLPLGEDEEIEHRIADLVAAGILSPTPATRPMDLCVGPARPGALDWFLRERG